MSEEHEAVTVREQGDLLPALLMLLEFPKSVIDDPSRVDGTRCALDISGMQHIPRATVRGITQENAAVIVTVDPFLTHGFWIDRIVRDARGWTAKIAEAARRSGPGAIRGFSCTVRFTTPLRRIAPRD